MKIYFSGSIRGGRRDVDFYSCLIEHLGKYGTVLTEHVGDSKLTCSGQIENTDSYIYKRDSSWIRGPHGGGT